MLSRLDGVILLVFFGLFVFYVYKSMKADGADNDKPTTLIHSLSKSLIFIIFGLALLVAGGKIVVDAAVDFARALNISEKVIGLTIVAVGTSLPELVTSVTAILKKSGDIAIGNIIGSNIFNIFLILGVCSTIYPIEYSSVFNRDIYLLVIGTLLLLFAMFTGKKRSFDRWEAAILFLLYIGYVIYLIMMNE